MAFNSKKLSVMAYANGFTIWNYQTYDDKDLILSKDYFDFVKNIINAGDLIYINIFDENNKCNNFLEIFVNNSGENGVEVKLLKGV